MRSKGWVGVDLDGTLAGYTKWRGATHIGEPVMKTLTLVSKMLDHGVDVRIFTARVSEDGTPERKLEAKASKIAVEMWCEKHLGQALPVTCCKDYACLFVLDDRSVPVEANTGTLLANEHLISALLQ